MVFEVATEKLLHNLAVDIKKAYEGYCSPVVEVIYSYFGPSEKIMISVIEDDRKREFEITAMTPKNKTESDEINLAVSYLTNLLNSRFTDKERKRMKKC